MDFSYTCKWIPSFKTHLFLSLSLLLLVLCFFFFCNKFLIIFHVRCIYQLISFNLSSVSSFQRDLVFLSNKQKVSVHILQLHFATVGKYPNQQAFYNASTVARMSLQCQHVDNKITVISKNSYYLSLFFKFQMALCQYLCQQPKPHMVYS